MSEWRGPARLIRPLFMVMRRAEESVGGSGEKPKEARVIQMEMNHLTFFFFFLFFSRLRAIRTATETGN